MGPGVHAMMNSHHMVPMDEGVMMVSSVIMLIGAIIMVIASIIHWTTISKLRKLNCDCD